MASIVGKLAARIVQRFPDPAMELAYLTGQRTRQARFIRTISTIFAVAILVNVATFAIFLRAESFGYIGALLLSYALVMLIYSWAVGRRAYVTGKWIDIAFFAAIQPPIYLHCVKLTQDHVAGWNLSAQLGFFLLVTLMTCCLAFSAAVSAYLFVAVVAVLYYAAVLATHGVGGEALRYPLNIFGTPVILLAYINWAIDNNARQLFRLTLDLDREKAKSDRLLDNVLPPEIAARLREDEEVADHFDGVAVLFADIVGFTALSERLGSHGTVDLLNRYFDRADQGTELFGMEKIKTIGDAYMAVAGALTRPALAPKAAVDFGAFLVHAAHEVGEELGLELRVRVGVNIGDVVGGVISTKRLSYDYWGDTINVAARLEGLAHADGITVSEAVYEALRDSYQFHPPRRALLKNLGERNVYDVDVEAISHAA